MARPGTEITARDTSPPRSAPTDTGVWFVTGIAEAGPSTAQHITSLDAFTDIYGGRVSYSVLYDSLETFFNEGGSSAYVARVSGPTPVKASANVFDQSGSTNPADRSLIATAKHAGEWYNSINVETTGGAGASDPFVVIISHDTDGTLETSPSLATRAEAVTWSAGSDYVDLTLGASAENPRAQGPTSFTSGADDHASITETEWTAALVQFQSTLGPGQVSAPGRSTSASHVALAAHALANGRVALCDAADVDDTGKSTLTTAVATDQTALTQAQERVSALLAGWTNIEGLVASTTRSVPPSATYAGLIARNDAVNDPGQAAAGVNGRSLTALEVRCEFSDDDYEDLNEAQVNMLRPFAQYDGEVRAYGYRTMALKASNPNHWQLSGARLFMAIRARGEEIAEHYVFGQIDGRGHLLSAYAGELTGMLVEFYNADALYGDTPAEAFAVSVGPDVNPVAQLADGIVKAVISIRVSPFGELVRLEIVKRSLTESLV